MTSRGRIAIETTTAIIAIPIPACDAIDPLIRATQQRQMERLHAFLAELGALIPDDWATP